MADIAGESRVAEEDIVQRRSRRRSGNNEDMLD